jgi:hypothetical protein
MATYKEISKWILSAFAHSLSGGEAGADYMLRNGVVRLRAQDIPDAAATDTWARTVLVADKAMNITAVKIIPDASLTANDTNYATLSFATGPVGTITSRDSFTTKITGGSGDWVANTAEAFTVATATDSLAAGEVMTVSKAVTAAGVIVPAHMIEIHWNYV